MSASERLLPAAPRDGARLVPYSDHPARSSHQQHGYASQAVASQPRSPSAGRGTSPTAAARPHAQAQRWASQAEPQSSSSGGGVAGGGLAAGATPRGEASGSFATAGGGRLGGTSQSPAPTRYRASDGGTAIGPSARERAAEDSRLSSGMRHSVSGGTWPGSSAPSRIGLAREDPAAEASAAPCSARHGSLHLSAGGGRQSVLLGGRSEDVNRRGSLTAPAPQARDTSRGRRGSTPLRSEPRHHGGTACGATPREATALIIPVVAVASAAAQLSLPLAVAAQLPAPPSPSPAAQARAETQQQRPEAAAGGRLWPANVAYGAAVRPGASGGPPPQVQLQLPPQALPGGPATPTESPPYGLSPPSGVSAVVVAPPTQAAQYVAAGPGPGPGPGPVRYAVPAVPRLDLRKLQQDRPRPVGGSVKALAHVAWS